MDYLSFLKDGGLVGSQLYGVTMKGQNMKGVDMSNSNLQSSDLSGSDFGGATLVGCDFSRAKLHGTRFNGAKMQNCILRGADCKDADFGGATLLRSDFSRTSIQWADFTGADVSYSDMSMCHGRGTLFQRTRMINVILRRCTLKNCLFVHARMDGSDWLQTDFFGSRWWKCEGLADVVNWETAIFYWWRLPNVNTRPLLTLGAGLSNVTPPGPGYVRVERSATGGYSLMENIGGEKVRETE